MTQRRLSGSIFIAFPHYEGGAEAVGQAAAGADAKPVEKGMRMRK